MDLNDAVVTCAVNVQWTNMNGGTGRKLSHRVATLRLVRNDLREIFIEVTPEKLKPLKLKLKDFTVHRNFMSEGKASIDFNGEKCILFISNAPPGPLVTFLKTIFIKFNTNENYDEFIFKKKSKSDLHSGRSSLFEDSSLTNTQVLKAGKGTDVSRESAILPSLQRKKRKIDDMDDKVEKSTAKKTFESVFTIATSSSCEENLKLNEEQSEVLQACLSGKNVFFTGSAGTGKSFLLRKIISAFPPDGTVITASTGVAACLIGGVTLHSFAGIGGGDANLSRCFEMVSRSINAQIWRRCKRLIVDEISMIDGQYFEKIEAVARHIRKNNKPFGGVQLILCGDFLQLPPIVKRNNHPSSLTQLNEKRFCFETPAWEKCIQIVYELKEVHRQSDKEFIKILNLLRIGRVTEEISKRLIETANQNIETNEILATQLCSHTNDANAINDSKLENLQGEKKVFRAEDSDLSMKKQLDQQVQAPSELILKIGAQVMLLKNINVSIGLVNGARGVVCKYTNNLPVVKFKNNIEYLCKPEKWVIRTPSGAVITRKQIPLKLAWAFSIHKSQGLTLDCVEMSLAKVFEAGQAYVALSRAKSLDSVRVLDFDSKQVWANPNVLRYYKIIRRRIHDMTIIPLGDKGVNTNSTSNNKGKIKLRKSVMDKPLVTIC